MQFINTSSNIQILIDTLYWVSIKIDPLKMDKNWLTEKQLSSLKLMQLKNIHSFGDVEVSKSKFVDALSKFKNILTMEQKAAVWGFVKQV